jgi:hypothetical protein
LPDYRIANSGTKQRNRPGTHVSTTKSHTSVALSGFPACAYEGSVSPIKVGMWASLVAGIPASDSGVEMEEVQCVRNVGHPSGTKVSVIHCKSYSAERAQNDACPWCSRWGRTELTSQTCNHFSARDSWERRLHQSSSKSVRYRHDSRTEEE